jgi:hypothetical protein
MLVLMVAQLMLHEQPPKRTAARRTAVACIVRDLLKRRSLALRFRFVFT